MKIKKLFSILFAFIITASVVACAVFSWPPARRALADSYYDEEKDKYIIDTNYWFQSVDVAIDINTDKTMRITETMKVGFLKADKNTGIIRDIQRISRTTRVINGEAEQGEQYFTQLSDVSVTIDGAPAKVTQSLYNIGQFHSVKMQKPDESYFEATDQKSDTPNYHEFKLSYLYDMSADKAEDYDDFTFDVLGYAMAFVRSFSATVTFPHAIDTENVSFRTNRRKEWEPDAEQGESVEITDRTVKIISKPMSDNKGYTVQVILPDGYFSEVSNVPKPPMERAYIPCFLLALAAMIAGGVLLFLYHTKKPVEQVEFYPPKGMSVMRYSAVWHGRARLKDIPAMVLKWAAEGYVKIEKDGKRDIFITKLKELPESEPYEEKEYLKALFYPIFTAEKGESEVFSSKHMRQNRLANYKKERELRYAAESLPELASEPNPVEKKALRARTAFQILSVVPLFALLLYYCIFLSTFFPMFFMIFITAGTMVGYVQLRSPQTPLMYIFPAMFTAIPMGAFRAIMYYPLFDYFGLIYIAIIWWAVSFLLFLLFKKRTPEAQSELGKMRGFKRFLLTAELSRIERVIKDDPFYYSAIIPYCLVMGISKKVEKRFKPLNLVLPEWTNGVPMSTFTHTLSHSISSSGGGGSSGGGSGGSSGGGGGGGGSRGC